MTMREDNFKLLIKFIGLLFVLFFIGYYSFSDLKLNYDRHLKNYDAEIEKYLKDNDLEYIEKRTPSNLDWENSPFEKPPMISIQPISINGKSYSSTKYQIIIASRNKKRYHIWVRIKTEFFSNPALTFAEKEE